MPAFRFTLLFCAEDTSSVQSFRCGGKDPQALAQKVKAQYPYLNLVAVIYGWPKIYPKDDARTLECGLDGWPE